MLETYADSDGGAVCELPWSRETISATDPFLQVYGQSISDGPTPPLSPAPIPLELGGNDTQASHPGTIDPAALSLDFFTQDKDGTAQSDTTHAMNAAMSFTFEDIAPMNPLLEEESEGECAVAEREETPETGRGNERNLSEDEDMSFPPGNPAGGQNTSRAPQVNNTGSSDTHVRPAFGPLLQVQPPQVNLPVQPSFGYVQPMLHHPMPHYPILHQSLAHQSVPQQPVPHQFLPHFTPGNTSLQFPQVAQPPHMQPAQHTGPVNQLDNHGVASAALTHMNRGSFAPTAYGGGPLQAPSYPQIPIQNSSEGRPQASTTANTHVSTRPENAAGRSTSAHWSQDPANSWPFPRAGLPPNINSWPTGPLPQSGSDPRPRYPSRLNPAVATFQPQEVIWSQSHQTPQRSVPQPQSATRPEAVIKENQNQHSSKDIASASSHRAGGPEPGRVALDPPGSQQIPRVTTPEAERMRISSPLMRDQPVLNVKIIMLAVKIMVKQKRGDPCTGLPGVTAEDVQEFRLQYRAMPVFIWSRELRIPDDKVRALLQAMRLLGLSLAELWQLRQPSGPPQSAIITQSTKPTESAQLPETVQPEEDGHVPEYLLDEFMAKLAQSGEQEARRFLRESKAKAARESQGPGPSRRKRRTAITGMSDEGPRRRMQGFSLDDIFYPGDIERLGTVIDDDLAAFGITEVKDARGQIMARVSSKRRDNVNSSPALNRTIDIHIEDDLVGAAWSSTPVEKFRRLMNSSPTRQSPKKRAKK